MTERNPYHEPAGSSKGGQFTSGQLNTITNAARKAAGLSSEIDVHSKEFREWFGNSKVVNKNGNPLLVYHGSSADFNEFNNKHQRVGGHWFSVEEEDAESYAGMGEEEHANFGMMPISNRYEDASKAYMYETYLSIQNPASKKVFDKILDEVSDLDLFIDPNGEMKAIERLISLGYDGIDNNVEWVAFYPWQIKINKKSSR